MVVVVVIVEVVVERRKKWRRKDRKRERERESRRDKIILPPPGISRQWPFPALANPLRDSTETISTIARTQPYTATALSRTRISSTDFLFFSPSPSLSLFFPFQPLLSLFLSPPPFLSVHHTSLPVLVTLALPLLVDDDDDKESKEENLLHTTHDTSRTTSNPSYPACTSIALARCATLLPRHVVPHRLRNAWRVRRYGNFHWSRIDA